MALIRNFLIFLSLFVFGSAAFAQETPAVDVQASATAVEPVPTSVPNVDLSGLDMMDPDVQAALKARDEADKAIIEAVMKQRRNAVETPAEVAEVSEESSSLTPDAIKAKAIAFGEKLLEWLKSPAFLAQLGAIAAAFFLAPIVGGQFRKRLFFFRDPPAEGAKLKPVRDYVFRSGNFLRAVMMVGLLALFAVVLKAVPNLGQDWLVKLAQGLAVVFLVYRVIKEFIPNELLKKIATWTAIPLALLAVFGYFDDLLGLLNGTTIMQMGDTPISLMTIIRLGIFGALFFWLGNLSNSKGQDAIRSQEGLDIATREVVAKMFQMLLFIVIAVLVLSLAGIPLSGLVMVFSAVGLGIGLGLQPIAANFVSGLIILFDRSVRKGDFVVLPDGKQGHVEAINMRNTVVETADGKDIMVPNTTFTEGTYENWTHKDPRQRYEVHFGVSYDTDIDKLEDIIIPAIKAYPKVLSEPEEPDLELREFGESGIQFAVEFWVSGIDDGPNKFTSDLNFIVWRALRDNGITIPFPQRVVHMVK